MALIVKIGTGWVNLDTVAAATMQEGTGALGLRFAGSTEFAYLDAQDSAIMREALDALAVNGHDAAGHTVVSDATAPVDRRKFDRSRPSRGYNRDE